jgi:hypothetical protein
MWFDVPPLSLMDISDIGGSIASVFGECIVPFSKVYEVVGLCKGFLAIVWDVL